MCKLNHFSHASPERLLVAAVRERVSPSLADWIGERVVDGASVEDVQKQLFAAIGQINRVGHYCTVREELARV